MKPFKNYANLVQFLRKSKMKISTAESCTGGLIAKLITDVPGSSRIFWGGIVSYSNEMKKKWLGVKSETLEKFGAVSEQTVEEMLTGIQTETGSDIAVAVSGIAGPGGGTPEKPLGTVFIGVLFQSNIVVNRFIFPGTRKKVRKQTAEKILQMIAEILPEGI